MADTGSQDNEGIRHGEAMARTKLFASVVANEGAYEAVQVLGGRDT